MILFGTLAAAATKPRFSEDNKVVRVNDCARQNLDKVKAPEEKKEKARSVLEESLRAPMSERACKKWALYAATFSLRPKAKNGGVSHQRGALETALPNYPRIASVPCRRS